MIPQSFDKQKELRNEAMMSVVHDMSGSRLKILGDLMETRKKAEMHEQEFLRTIHTENAAFGQIVALFESQMKEFYTVAQKQYDACIGRVSALADDSESIKRNIRDTVESEFRIMKDMQAELKSSTTSTMDFHRTRLSELAAEVAGLSDKTASVSLDIGSARSESGQLNLDISAIRGNLEQIESKHTAAIEQMNAAVSEMRHQCEQLVSSSVANMKEETRTEIIGVRDSFSESFAEIRDWTKTYLHTLLDERMADWASSLHSAIEAAVKDSEGRAGDLVVSANLPILERIDQMESQLNQLGERLETTSRKVDFESDSASSLPVYVSEKINSAMQYSNSEYNSQITLLHEQMQSISAMLSSRLSRMESTLTAVASSGYYHEWVIETPKQLLSCETGKFVSSELFSIGPYRDLQLRLFPNSSVVWLVQVGRSVTSVGPPPPTYVDLSVGRSKRSMCEIKKVAELFGHWVWEASGFDPAVVEKESNGYTGSLTIAVEISMRQWLLKEEIGMGRLEINKYEEEIPEVYNPFEKSHSTWAKFGNDNDDIVVAIDDGPGSHNPFRH